MNLSNNPVADYQALAELSELRELKLKSNRIKNLEFTNKLGKLRRLDLTGAHIEDIGALAESKIRCVVFNKTTINKKDEVLFNKIDKKMSRHCW